MFSINILTFLTIVKMCRIIQSNDVDNMDDKSKRTKIEDIILKINIKVHHVLVKCTMVDDNDRL